MFWYPGPTTSVECQINLTGFVCVLCNWRNKFQIQRFSASSISSISHSLSIGFQISHGLLLELVWHMGRSLLSSPFFVSTSAAFLFWFLLWFPCILAFSFELRVNVASLELTFGRFDCFVWRFFPFLRLSFAAVFFSYRGSSTETEISWLGSLSADFNSS